ncbi:MAG TPA: glycosyltransferase family 39 protein [Solirubrobacteraceae bacterium]|nr:glycosyltransferase family 39 protein [Solirubrobacteraceae bacterium]
MAALLIAAFVIRLVYVENTYYKAKNDAGTYNRMASNVAQYGDYRTGSGPGSGAGGSRGPTAYFPPAFPYSLAVVDLIDGHQAGGKTAVRPERIAQAVVGTISVGLLGLVALEVFGGVVAVAAIAIAAVYPVFVELSGTLVAENLLMVFELASIWTALRARRARRLGGAYAWIAATGILTGLATLTHENAVLFVLPLGVAAWSVARARGVGGSRVPRRSALRALVAPAVLVLCTCAVIAPWTIRNAVELHHLVPVSDETGITLLGTYNATSAAARPVHYKWDLFLKMPEFQTIAKAARRYDEVGLSDQLQSRALDYIRAHPFSPLDVAFHNTLRMFELEGSFAWHASYDAIGLPARAAGIGVVSFWVLLALAIAGLFTAVRREAPRWLWAFPVLYWLSIAFVNVETPRFREPIDPFLVLLAACAVATAAHRAGGALGLGGPPVRRRRRPSELAGDHAELVKVVKRLA